MTEEDFDEELVKLCDCDTMFTCKKCERKVPATVMTKTGFYCFECYKNGC